MMQSCICSPTYLPFCEVVISRDLLNGPVPPATVEATTATLNLYFVHGSRLVMVKRGFTLLRLVGVLLTFVMCNPSIGRG